MTTYGMLFLWIISATQEGEALLRMVAASRFRCYLSSALRGIEKGFRRRCQGCVKRHLRIPASHSGFRIDAWKCCRSMGSSCSTLVAVSDSLDDQNPQRERESAQAAAACWQKGPVIAFKALTDCLSKIVEMAKKYGTLRPSNARCFQV